MPHAVCTGSFTAAFVKLLWPPVVLVAVCTQVKALHRYMADDVDELSFDAGEIISVIPFEDEYEQVHHL